jgi:hypothetical protein
MVATAPKIDFDLQPVATDAMMKAGISEDVIKAMAARENGTQMSDIQSAVPASDPATQPSNSRLVAGKAEAGTSDVITNAQARTNVTYSAGPHDSAEHRLTYDGGSIPGLQTGTEVKMYVDQNQVRIVKKGMVVAAVPASAITEISYGQDVHRRVGAAIGLATVSFGIGALMALTKSKKHFIGITWSDAGGKGGAAFQADKNDYRGLLAGLEGVSGKSAVDSSLMTVKN